MSSSDSSSSSFMSSSETEKKETERMETEKTETEKTEERKERETKEIVTLRSSDGQIFEVENEVASVSRTIRDIVSEGCAESVIPIPCVTGEFLAKIIVYCKEHLSRKALPDADWKTKEKFAKWDEEFIDVDTPALVQLLNASNFLDIQGLLDIGIDKFANMIKNKYPQEIRDLFNIENDFTPEEEEEIRKKNEWAFYEDPYYPPKSSKAN